MKYIIYDETDKWAQGPFWNLPDVKSHINTLRRRFNDKIVVVYPGDIVDRSTNDHIWVVVPFLEPS